MEFWEKPAVMAVFSPLDLGGTVAAVLPLARDDVTGADEAPGRCSLAPCCHGECRRVAECQQHASYTAKSTSQRPADGAEAWRWREASPEFLPRSSGQQRLVARGEGAGAAWANQTPHNSHAPLPSLGRAPPVKARRHRVKEKFGRRRRP